MNKGREIQLRHLFEALDAPDSHDEFYHVQLFCDYDQWIKFKICCYFQGVDPMYALNDFVKRTSQDQIVEWAREYAGGE